MRLLERTPNGGFVFREFTDKDIPVYAILSHTWMAQNEEVNFQDIETGTGLSKAGWIKIKLCADRAAANGLRYFWIDTCCIDRKNSTELSKAINSMFNWYQKAARCYVYLADVSALDGKETSQQDSTSQQGAFHWETAFRKSRWFKRGWTLQELLAPPLVDFFSLEGEPLGNKSSLETIIHSITGIPKEALNGGSLSGFSSNERLSWASNRVTKEEEDHAYSLLGIFGVSMPLIYGEGKEKATRRLHEEIEKIYKVSAADNQFIVGLDLSTIPDRAKVVSREEELAELYRLLYGHTSRSIAVLHGLGGIGKTQLAIEYALRHKEKYSAIYWLDANDKDSLKLSFRNVAQQILDHHSTGTVAIDLDNLDQAVNADNLDQAVNAVKLWLGLPKNTRWLMIYDNYDNPKIPGNADISAVDLKQFLPRPDHGSVIITTRSSQVGLGHHIHVEKLGTIQAGLEILSNTSRRKGIESDVDAVALVKELDGLPLALATAGEYLAHVAMSFSEYLRLYKASWSKLQTTSPRLNSYEHGSLYTTWRITFDRIEKQNPAAAKLLKLWAYLDRQDIWFDLIRHANCSEDEWIKKLTEDELSFNEAVTLLCSFGLVDIDRSLQPQFGSGGYTVHSCVHSWMISVLNEKWDNSLATLALKCIASKVPDSNQKNWWLLQQRLLPHALVCHNFVRDGKVDTNDIEWALHRLGVLYANQYKLTEAELMYCLALQGMEKALGAKHRSTLETIHCLAKLLQIQDRPAEAEQMYTRVLQGKEETLGPKHVSTLETVRSLALFYRDVGSKLDEAEGLYKRVLQGKIESLGDMHLSTIEAVNDLAILHKIQGRFEEAEQKHLWVLQRREEIIGLNHILTLETLNNLGNVYLSQGRLLEAEKMYNRSLRGMEKALGAKHQHTLYVVNNLGLLYVDQGRLAEAEQMYTRAVQGKEEVLGTKHTSTLDTLNNLGLLYVEQGRLAEAEELYIRSLRGKEEVLRSEHRLILETIMNLGDLYRKQGRLNDAELMLNRALKGHEDSYGLTHVYTLITVNNLGLLRVDQRKFAEAEALYTRALCGYETAIGDHAYSYVSTLNTLVNLGDLYSYTGEHEMAETMYKKALPGFIAAQGPSSNMSRSLVSRLKTLETGLAQPKTLNPLSKDS